jgi:hypothetical protein
VNALRSIRIDELLKYTFLRVRAKNPIYLFDDHHTAPEKSLAGRDNFRHNASEILESHDIFAERHVNVSGIIWT